MSRLDGSCCWTLVCFHPVFALFTHPCASACWLRYSLIPVLTPAGCAVWVFQRSGGSGWAGGAVSSSAQAAAALGDTGWLQHLHTLLAGAAYIAALVSKEATSVLVHCR